MAEVKIGQVWQDNDPRRPRQLTVMKENESGTHWGCRVEGKGGKLTWIRKDRLRAFSAHKGYRLVKDAVQTSDALESSDLVTTSTT